MTTCITRYGANQHINTNLHGYILGSKCKLIAQNQAIERVNRGKFRLDAEQVEDDAEVIQIALERAQRVQQDVGWQERNVQWLESASNRVGELKRRSTARNAARERTLILLAMELSC
jgi:hypothetical protein